MNGKEMVRRMLVLRHTFQVNCRLKLEFQAMLSRLLREHGVPVETDLLRELILAVPDELIGESRSDYEGVPRPKLASQPETIGPQPPPGAEIGPQPPPGAEIGPQPPPS